MQVGFVGLGSMGGPMAMNLLKGGTDLTVFDTRSDAMEVLVESGASPSSSAAELAAACEVIFLSLPNNDIVDQVVNEELVAELDPGDVVVDTSTVQPSMTDRNAERLAEVGATMIGAPVSGGLRGGAEDGTLSIIVGGDPEVVDRCRPLFQTFASDIYHVGHGPSDGHKVKLLNNYLSFVAMVATSEATIIGQEAGLDMDTMLEVFNTSSGRNSATQTKFPEYIAKGSFDSGADLGLVKKDISLATSFAEELDTPMLLGETVCQLLGYVYNEYGHDGDYLRMYSFFEDVMTKD